MTEKEKTFGKKYGVKGKLVKVSKIIIHDRNADREKEEGIRKSSEERIKTGGDGHYKVT